MSSPAIALETTYPLIESLSEASPEWEAEEVLLRRGFCCTVTRRVDIRLLTQWKQKAYEYFCRELRAKWRVPPAPPMTRGVITSFDQADAECISPDDQLHIIPYQWAYSGDEIDIELVCRPRDPADAERYKHLKARFNIPSIDSAVLADLAARLCELRTENEKLRGDTKELRMLSDCVSELSERFEKMVRDLSGRGG